MRQIVDLLDPRSVEPALSARRKREAIEEMVAVLGRSLSLADPEGWTRELWEREKLASTGVGGGIGIPHRLFPGLDRTAVALGRSHGGISFDAIDGKPVNILFLIVGPDGQAAEHLRLLSRLARLMRDPTMVRELLDAPDARGMLEALRARDTE